MSEVTTLYFSFMFCLAGTTAGFIIGWFANAYYTSYHQERELEDIHPEFLDSNGNYIQEELLAVRFVDDESESEDD